MSSANDKQKILRQQAIILDHARTCKFPCKLPYCNIMKDIIEHLKTCEDITKCSTPRCTSSRKILQHKERCTRAACPICGTNEQNAQNNELMDQSLNMSQFNATNTSGNMGTDVVENSMCANDSFAANDSLANISTSQTPVRNTHRPISNLKENADLNISQLVMNAAAMNLVQSTPNKMDSVAVNITGMANSGTDQFANVQIRLGNLERKVAVKLPPIKEWHQGGFASAIVNAINATISSNLVQVARVNNNGIVVSKELFRKFAEPKQSIVQKTLVRRKSIYRSH